MDGRADHGDAAEIACILSMTLCADYGHDSAGGKSVRFGVPHRKRF